MSTKIDRLAWPRLHGREGFPGCRRERYSLMNVGKTGEAAAVALLERHGFQIVDTNVRFGQRSGLVGELDIVAWDQSTLAFIEVKTRRGTPGQVLPAENVTLTKQRQLARLALAYLVKTQLGDEETISIRFDVVTVVLAPGESGRVLRTELTRGAFIAPEGDYE